MVGERLDIERSDEGFFLCLKPECNTDDMSEEERQGFNKGIREMINYANEIMSDDSLWKN